MFRAEGGALMKTQSDIQALEAALQHYCNQAGPQLRAVCLHALAGGGRTRANLLLRATEPGNRLAVQAACALEMMHAATLLQDDIFDRSAERRGRRAAYLKFSEAQAVLASDWLLLRALELAADVHPSFFQQLACAARSMAAAVAKELKPPILHGFPEAHVYVEEICQGKTASLFAVALYGAALLNANFGWAHAAGWAAVGSRLGCAYQLVDDCLDVYAPEGTLNKSTGVDLRQGRLTLPILKALQALESAGPGISIDRFRRAGLTATEMANLERTIADQDVRTCLEREVNERLTKLEESARTAAIPWRSINSAVQDMEAKAALCFSGEAQQLASELEQFHPVFAL